MIKPQYIYLAVDFIFDKGNPTPKFFVAFHCDEDKTLLFSLTTSKKKLPTDVDNSTIDGCIYFSDHRGYAHAFVWNKGTVIGQNNYSFSERTYVQLEYRAHLREVNTNDVSTLVTNKIIEKCKLTNSAFRDLLQCLLKSKFLQQKYKAAILEKISELS